MRIAAAQLSFATSHQASVSLQRSESLRAWVGNPSSPPPAESAPVSLSSSAPGESRFAVRTECLQVPSGETSKENSDPQWSLLQTLLERIFGQKITLFDPRELNQGDASSPPVASSGNAEERAGEVKARDTPALVGWGIAYDASETYRETEQTHFQASGQVHTSDGKEINFRLSLSMQREYVEESHTRLLLGDARLLKDPLVLNFDGTAAKLSDWRFDFDLNADGTSESLPFVTGGKALLAFDRNSNGRIDDGRELFGPSTGNGFSELAELDQDGNGWIDENDSTFSQLHLWSKSSAENDQLEELGERGIGALSLAALATPFALRDSRNQSLGELRQSGVFLQEDGKAGTMQQVDIAI